MPWTLLVRCRLSCMLVKRRHLKHRASIAVSSTQGPSCGFQPGGSTARDRKLSGFTTLTEPNDGRLCIGLTGFSSGLAVLCLRTASAMVVSPRWSPLGPKLPAARLMPTVCRVSRTRKAIRSGSPSIKANTPCLIRRQIIRCGRSARDYSPDHNVGPRHTVAPSLQWLITPNTQLDIGAYIGITKAAPDYNPYVGVSFRY